VIERTSVAHPAALHSLFARIPDQRLVKLAAGGSAPAFATIYRRHHQELYRYCRSLLGNDDEAGDALQNTMLRALRGLDGERREIALRPWLFRIAHNESISLIRSRGKALPLAPEAVAGSGGRYDLDTRQQLDSLMSDVAQLSTQQRSALMMRELSGLEFSEIAAALKTSPEAAKQAVYQARVALGELAEGRDMNCDEVRRKLSADDRRRLRGRRVRAHLRGCTDCRDFQRQMRDRSRVLAGFAPTLCVPGASAVLEGALGAGGAGGGITGLLGTAAGVKVTATVAAAVAVSAGVYATEHTRESRSVNDNPPAAEASVAGAGGKQGIDRANVTYSHPSRGDGGASGSGARSSASDGHRGGETAGASTNALGGTPDAGAATGSQVDPAGPEASGGQNGPALVPEPRPPVQGQPPADQPPGQVSPPSAPTAPPGHGGVPPGQGGAPPGQSGAAPGQTGAPPGQSGLAPGHGGTPPGLGGTPPGLGGTPPGLGGKPPGRALPQVRAIS
jgi:RNA polymerase sigma factor (sigma-70 family)